MALPFTEEEPASSQQAQGPACFVSDVVDASLLVSQVVSKVSVCVKEYSIIIMHLYNFDTSYDYTFLFFSFLLLFIQVHFVVSSTRNDLSARDIFQKISKIWFLIFHQMKMISLKTFSNSHR